MSTITSLNANDNGATSRGVINTNVTNLNTDKLENSSLTGATGKTTPVDADTMPINNSADSNALYKVTWANLKATLQPAIVGKPYVDGISYAADSVGSDAYAVTLSPAATSYYNGMVIVAKVATANTGACTMNVNGLGAKTIKKQVSVDTSTGDILANSIIVLVYDGTNMQLVSSVPTTTNPVAPTNYTPAASGTATLDLAVNKRNTITMPAGNITIALSNVAVGNVFFVDITQDGVGSRTVTWFTTIKWAGGVAPTLTTTLSKRDTFGFVCTGSGTYDGYIIGKNI